MNIAIIDDLKQERENLKEILESYASMNNLHMKFDIFESAEALLDSYMPLKYTIIFLDIYLDGMTGIEAATKIREVDPDTCIIFQTISMEHQSDAFRIHAFDYLEKPAQSDAVFRIMDDLLKRRTIETERLTIYSDKRNHAIAYSDIVTVIASGHYLEITDINGNVYLTRMTLESVASKLTVDKGFLLIMRGSIVNMNYILDFSNGVCKLTNGLYLEYSKRKKRSLEQVWQNYIFSRLHKEAIARD